MPRERTTFNAERTTNIIIGETSFNPSQFEDEDPPPLYELRRASEDEDEDEGKEARRSQMLELAFGIGGF